LGAEALKPLRPVACVIEVLHRISGMMPHALLAGTFEPSNNDRLLLEVVKGAPFDLSGPSLTGPLGRWLTPGLPPELADAAVEGFVTAPTEQPLPSGIIKVTGGAIDDGSSPMAFLRCGAALRGMLSATAVAADPNAAIVKLIGAW
jgi:hypothetical protein